MVYYWRSISSLSLISQFESTMLEDQSLSNISMEKHISQQAHEKMLNIAKHQVNGNQNHNEISPHACQSDWHQKEHK